MNSIYLKLTILCLLGLAANVVESGDDCCSKRKENMVELKTLTEIMLELISKCGVTSKSTTTTKTTTTTTYTTTTQTKTVQVQSSSSTIARAPSGVTSCDKLHGYPLDCVYNLCDYDCAKKKCGNGDSVGFVKGNSSMYCFSPCNCNKAGYAYDVETGDCKDRKPICDAIKFFPGSCQRANKGKVQGKPCPNIFYAYKGVLCKNTAQKGNCKIEKTILAVNLASSKSWHERTFSLFNGGSLKQVVDQDEVKYQFDHEIKYSDPKNVAKGDQSDPESVNGKKTELTAHCNEPLLYGSQVWGDRNIIGNAGRAKGWQGVTYDIPLTKDGLYELNLKDTENQPKYKVGSRAFNIFFNGVWVLPEVDILHTAPVMNGVDWIINFMVSGGGKKISILGYEDSDLKNGVAKLSFYFGICGTMDENFHVAAFAVNKFK